MTISTNQESPPNVRRNGNETHLQVFNVITISALYTGNVAPGRATCRTELDLAFGSNQAPRTVNHIDKRRCEKFGV